MRLDHLLSRNGRATVELLVTQHERDPHALRLKRPHLSAVVTTARVNTKREPAELASKVSV